MKRTCAYCGMFEDEDDILVCCQEPDCSLRSADYEILGVFHGRCGAALGHSGGARWQNCPWSAAVIGVGDSDEEKYFHLDDAVGGGKLRRPNDPAGMEMVPQKDCASGRMEEETAGEVAERPGHDLWRRKLSGRCNPP